MKNKYGRLTIISAPYRVDGRGKNLYISVECECGEVKSVRKGHLVGGETTSCGCYRKEIAGFASIKHGLTNKHPLWSVWINMKNRCYNKNVPSYDRYGGAGVRVCKEWKHNFKKFYDWCISNGWEEGLQLDKDKIPYPNKGKIYSPKSCCFLTPKENNLYKKSTKLSKDIAEIVREKYATGNYTMAELGKTYMVGATAINAVIQKRNWV